jgi:hypothetical protein
VILEEESSKTKDSLKRRLKQCEKELEECKDQIQELQRGTDSLFNSHFLRKYAVAGFACREWERKING